MLMGFILGLGFDIRVRVSEWKVAMTQDQDWHVQLPHKPSARLSALSL